LDAPHQLGKCLVARNQRVVTIGREPLKLLSDLLSVELVEKPAQDLGFRIVLIRRAERRRGLHPTKRRV
jgi:hypothetical protein